MGHEFPSVKLLKAAGYLLPKPYVMIDVILHKLLHILVGAAADIGSNTIKFGLDL